jgi:hypothetical protein
MLEKRKSKKTKLLCMLFLITAILAGSATAYARTVTDTGKTLRGWTYTFSGTYNSSDGKTSGYTKASFVPHTGCYASIKVYIPNGKIYKERKVASNTISWAGNVGKKNDKIRIFHGAYSKKGACYAGGHTIY